MNKDSNETRTMTGRSRGGEQDNNGDKEEEDHNCKGNLTIRANNPTLARENQSKIEELGIQPTTHLAREIQREYSKDHLARVNYLTRLPRMSHLRRWDLSLSRQNYQAHPASQCSLYWTQSATNITKDLKTVLNLARGT